MTAATAIRGYPTTYRGTRFSSRLEAKWAAWMDLVGWRWVYEPFDVEGWIPDFLVQTARPFLVEVGPVSTPEEFLSKAAKPLLYPSRPTLILGISPIVLSDTEAGIVVDGGETFPAYWMQCDQHPDQPFLTHVSLWTDHHGGMCGHGIGLPLRGSRLFDLWADAGNRVQWRRR